MTPDEIAAVRSSFAMVPPNARAAGGLFYDKLFDSIHRCGACSGEIDDRRQS